MSPIQENVIVASRPWWERYQPISYLWNTRSGTADEFKAMVRKCNDVGVRIYVDVVFNHMTGDHKVALGTGNSVANTYNREYPAVPYIRADFHPTCAINDYQDPVNVRNCELVGLHDLNQTIENVREKIVDFLNEAIDAGVAGFRLAENPLELENFRNRAFDRRRFAKPCPALSHFIHFSTKLLVTKLLKILNQFKVN